MIIYITIFLEIYIGYIFCEKHITHLVHLISNYSLLKSLIYPINNIFVYRLGPSNKHIIICPETILLMAFD